MHPQHLEIKDFTYPLPDERIAKHPLPQRDASKLLVYKNHRIEESTYQHLHQFIPENSLLVFNNTKVIQARLLFKTGTGAAVEVFCLEPDGDTEMATAMSTTATTRWKCLVGRAAKWKEKQLTLRQNDFVLKAEIISRIADAFVIEFNWQPAQLTFAEILEHTGAMPIPPYLKRESEVTDATRYQTIYAKTDGSVAAPTAGLHFTESVFEKLEQKNISIKEVTLHVGAGTFKPVKTETIGEHTMHAEWIDVDLSFIESLLETKAHNKTVIAVGTTSLRTLESLYWMGVKAAQNPEASLHDLEIRQWDAYETLNEISVTEALTALRTWMGKNKREKLIAHTQILIAPPYQLKTAGALITNFHQPNSTLLLLVAAVAGEKWKEIYDYALGNNFRFLSYGDGSLLFVE